jgi:glucose-1-phosphate thymidylyltransferase
MLKNQYGQYLLKVIDEMKEEINSNTFTHPEMKGGKFK